MLENGLMSKCSKKYYPNGPTAMVAKLSVEARHGGTFRAYKCNRCDGWHLTTQMNNNRILRQRLKRIKSDE